MLKERDHWQAGMHLECLKPKCSIDATSCCAKQLLGLEPDFKEQKSPIQEIIEAAGHMCIFLPKFYCELNFIEFSWGGSQKYLCNHCDYTFTILKENLLKALVSVDVKTIWQWEHQMIWWVDAYRDGKSTKEAQLDL